MRPYWSLPPLILGNDAGREPAASRDASIAVDRTAHDAQIFRAAGRVISSAVSQQYFAVAHDVALHMQERFGIRRANADVPV